jgi:hypothetical protein
MFLARGQVGADPKPADSAVKYPEPLQIPRLVNPESSIFRYLTIPAKLPILQSLCALYLDGSISRTCEIKPCLAMMQAMAAGPPRSSNRGRRAKACDSCSRRKV